MKNNKIILLVAAATVFGLASCSKGGKTSGVSNSVSAVDTTVVAPSDSLNSTTSDNSVESTLSEEPLDPVLTGEGTKQNPYVISNSAQLLTFASSAKDAYYVLGSDIDCKGMEWNSVGTTEEPFTGMFDGQGHTISNLKFTEYNGENRNVGFIGVAQNAIVCNVTFDSITMDLTIFGFDDPVCVGAVIAQGQNSVVENVYVNYSKCNVASTINGSGTIYAGGAIGYMSTAGVGQAICVSRLSKVAVTGDVIYDMTDMGENATVVTGGVLGTSFTGSGSSVYQISNCSFNGKLQGGMYVGGIASYLDTYSSITNCYVKSQSIKSATLDGAYVGGIVGKAQADTAIIGCVVDVDKVEVPHSTSSLYKSYAGFAAGYYGTKADYVSVYGFYQEGCGIYDTYAKEGIVVSADKSFETVSETLNTALYKDKAKFSEKVWDLSGTTPTLKKDGKLENVTVTLDIQNEAYQNQTFTVEPGEFNVELATATMYGEYFKKGYSYNDFCYDTEGKESYRWYAPIVNDTTLYAKWVDISGIAGNYEYTLTYGVYTHTGNWIFEDDKFTWVNENSVMKYRYAYDDELELMYIVEYIGIETAPRSAFGGYVGSLFVINDDGSISTLDVNDEETVYTAYKKDYTVYIPDYTNSPVLGTWYCSNNAIINLYKDGNADGITQTSTVKYYGGYRFEEGTLDVTISGRFNATGDDKLDYDAENNIFVSNDYLVAREKIEKIYQADDGLKLYQTATKSYAVKFGEVVANSFEGELVDGGTITIAGGQYKVNGTTLKKEATVVVPGGDDVKENTYLGTWNVKAGLNNGTITLNEDGTATFNTATGTYTVTGNKIHIALNNLYEFDLTYDSANQTLKGTMEDDDCNDYEVNSTGYTAFEEKEEEETVVKSHVGTWTGTSGSNSIVIEIKSDGSFKYGELAGTYTMSGNKITASLSDDSTVTLTYDETKQEIKGTWTDEFGEYNFPISCSTYAPESNKEEANTNSIAGTYRGTWGTSNGSSAFSIVLNDDGTATIYNSDNAVCITFNYTYDGTTFATSNIRYVNDFYDELTLTFKSDKNQLVGRVVYDYDYPFDIVATK